LEKDRLQSHKRKDTDRQMLVDKEQARMYDNGVPNQTAQRILNDMLKTQTKNSAELNSVAHEIISSQKLPVKRI